MAKFLVHAPMHGVPELGTVLTPVMNRTYAGWSSRGQIYGQPGTIPIAAPRPAGMPQNNLIALAAIGQLSPSYAPNHWYPAIYYEAGNPKEHFPGSLSSDNQIPVPAEKPPNVIVFSPYRARLGGQRQVFQPQAVPRWRGMKGTTYG